ncbi:Asparagine synthase [Trinorchestia longiramus]|nr:Asparagine synthase [Trinorchestia longiramus]
MCGISVEVFTCSCHQTCARNFKEIPELLLSRGPDASSCITVQLQEVSIVLKGTVLWLQGEEPVSQPIRDEDGNILLFNGDVLAGVQMPVEGECDSVHLLRQLRAAVDEEVPDVMSGIIGPWTFIYWRVATQRLYFGRDVLGRHSLLWSKTGNSSRSATASETNSESELVPECCTDKLSGKLSHSPTFVLSSVGFGFMEMEEVPAKGIFALNLKDLNCTVDAAGNKFSLALVPWKDSSNHVINKDLNLQILDEKLLKSPIRENLNMTLPKGCVDQEIGHPEENIFEHLNKEYYCYTNKFLFLLQRAVQRRVYACPPCCISCAKNSDSLSQAWSSNRSCEVHKFGSEVIDECKGKYTSISVDANTGTTCDKCDQQCSKISSRRMTSDELKSCSDYATNEYSEVHNSGSSQHNNSAHRHADGECLQDTVKSCTRGQSKCSHCRIAVLFSGGLDSAMIAFLLDKCLPKEESIDLINVAFPAPKRKQQVKKKKKLHAKTSKTNSSHESSKNEETCQEFELESLSKGLMACSKDEGALSDEQGFHPEQNDSQSRKDSQNSPIGTQNSKKQKKCETRLDSADEDKHDSQSFERSVSPQNGSKRTTDDYEVPDRCTGRECLKQLRSLCPDRHWNFVEVDVSKEELSQHRAGRISSLLKPLNTVLDDSIGCALWFAGRARGVVNGTPYTSRARVVLCGHGADEQLCGYSRHRSVWGSGGLRALLQEVYMEVDRLPTRNLGRDNRVLADNARAPRFPYLDEDVVSYLNSLPIWVKANLSLPRGVGEKLLLRVLAHQVGLTVAAGLPKRAIQFGSRIAKMDDRKEKGDQVCDRLLNG